jgi:hypothetical protein
LNILLILQKFAFSSSNKQPGLVFVFSKFFWLFWPQFLAHTITSKFTFWNNASEKLSKKMRFLKIDRHIFTQILKTKIKLNGISEIFLEFFNEMIDQFDVTLHKFHSFNAIYGHA